MTTVPTYLIQGGYLVTMNSHREVFPGDLRIEGQRIVTMGSSLTPKPNDIVIQARGNFVIPGFVQAHTHLCQALFRGLADDLSLLDWLTKKIWPFEAAHNEKSLAASSRLALLEMQLLGTTSVLDMGTTRHTHSLFSAVDEMQMRYWGGNCWADLKSMTGPIYMDTATTQNETEDLIKTWHKQNSLIHFAICPRFGLSCSERILKYAVQLQHEKDLLIHTHASENRQEVEWIKKRTGFNNVDYLSHLGLLNSKTVLVHGVHLTKSEIKKMSQNQTKLVHCPSSNLKLASGIAPIETYRQAGITIGLGADGAPCNNTMDPFLEMRLSALLQKKLYGPTALPAINAFEMATIKGAEVLGYENKIGSLEINKYADIAIVDRKHPSSATVEDPYSALVYSSSGRDVQHVWINGKQVVKNFRSTLVDEEEVTAQAKQELLLLKKRVI